MDWHPKVDDDDITVGVIAEVEDISGLSSR